MNIETDLKGYSKLFKKTTDKCSYTGIIMDNENDIDDEQVLIKNDLQHLDYYELNSLNIDLNILDTRGMYA